jgi:prepilin-type N-terminal cleavage/methylation domain-containing protein
MRIRIGKIGQSPAAVLQRLRKVDGFSLLELVITIMLLSVAIPGIVEMYNTALTNSHVAEIQTIAVLLATEQMETIIAHKAGSGAGFGYASITQARYASVNPGAPYGEFTRSVTIQTVNPGAAYEYKSVAVTVNHPVISAITLTTMLYDHSAI